MANNWSLRLVLGVFCLTGYTRLGTSHPLPVSPQDPTGLTPNPSPRGEGSDMLCLLHACYLSTRQLPNRSSTSQSLVFLLTWYIASCPFVHFSAIFLTRRVPFLSTNCSPCRKNSILAEVCFKAKRG